MGIFSVGKNPGFFVAPCVKKSWIFFDFSMEELTTSYNVSKGKVPEKFLQLLKNCQNFDHFFHLSPVRASIG
jgi:hypothetical protein